MKTAGLFLRGDDLSRAPSWLDAPLRRAVKRDAGFALALLDVTIGVGRKLGGFCALVALAVMFARVFLLGETPRQLYPDAADPALRMTFATLTCLVLAQGWDFAPARIAADWVRLRAYLPSMPAAAPLPALPMQGAVRLARRCAALLNAGVAASNKAGALGAFASLGWLGLRVASGTSLRALYPGAPDPALSLAADLAVDLLVLGWWSTSFAEIVAPWRRFRQGR